MEILKIYTDGGCRGNQSNKNIGGWGSVLVYGKHAKRLSGGEENTTNNRMEMTALLEAFKAIKKDGQVIEVYSDSSYLMDCFRKKWYVNWQRNGWKTAQKKPVENQDLWEQLISYLDRHKISFYRVKGHINLDGSQASLDKLYDQFKTWNGDHFTYEDFLLTAEMNIECDNLVNEAMDNLKKG